MKTLAAGADKERRLFAEADATRDAALLEQDKREAQAEAAHALIQRETKRDSVAADARIVKDISMRGAVEKRDRR